MEEILSWAGDGEDDMAFKYNIIRAFEDERAEGKAEGKAEGIAEGKAEGMTLKLVSLVRKKIHKNKTVEEIAEILEEEPDTITPIWSCFCSIRTGMTKEFAASWQEKDPENRSG